MAIKEKLIQRYPHQLNPDAEQGFADAVHNNQVSLAMYYMIELVSDMQKEIEELKAAQSKSETKKTAKKASAKKTTETTKTDE